MITLSIIIPTLGRPTLTRMLDSIAHQPLMRDVGDPSDGDEVLVIGDGPQPAAEELVKFYGEPFRYLEGPRDHCWGNMQRNFALPLARGDYIVFCDDDNVLLPGAFGAIRRGVANFPGRPVIFKVRFLSGDIAPSRPGLRCSDFDTACGVWPRERLALWGRAYEGDYLFARDTLALYPKGESAAVWASEVIAAHRPHSMPPGEFEKFALMHAPDAGYVPAGLREQ